MRHFLMVAIIGIYAISCGSSIKIWNGGDFEPPKLVSMYALNTSSWRMIFDEEIDTSSLVISIAQEKTITFSMVNTHDNEFTLQSNVALVPGKEYVLSLQASDVHGNSLLSIHTIYGFNARIPRMRINEFTCEGSKTNADKVELIALSDGNLAGLAIQQGGVQNYKLRVMLPSIEVKTNDFVVIHFRPYPNQKLIHEYNTKTDSTHAQAIDTAWDVFSPHDTGISNTNGSIALISLFDLKVHDAVVYSTKQDDDTHKYRGFSSKDAFLWANELASAHQWNIAHEESGIRPSDAVASEASTTTRSISRSSKSTDTNSKDDWHISPSRKSSFGAVNTDEKHMPWLQN